MKLLLDTANLDDIKNGLDVYPLSGITTNPSIIKKEGKVDFYKHFFEIKSLLKDKQTLHIQVVEKNSEKIIKEARLLIDKFGKDICIKIPVSSEGIKAIKLLSNEGFNITATAVYTTMQGLLAIMAGAKYVAVYFNRMENIDINPITVIHELSEMINKYNYNCEIIAASFKNVKQITESFGNGAHACTVSYDLLKSVLTMPSIIKAVDDFANDWKSVFNCDSILHDFSN